MAKNTDFKSALAQLEDTLEVYLVDKAPFSIPDQWKDLIVKFAPYLALLGVFVVGLGLLSALGLTTMMAPALYYYGSLRLGFWYWLSIAFSAFILILEGLAVKPLFARQEKGWRFVFYACLVSAVSSIVNFASGGLIGGLIGLVVSLYILFQVKSYYK